jgi:hypothetical protein
MPAKNQARRRPVAGMASNSHVGNNIVIPAGMPDKSAGQPIGKGSTARMHPVPRTVTGRLRQCVIKHPHNAEFAILGRWIPSSLTE